MMAQVSMVACRLPFGTTVLLPAPTRPRQSPRPRSIDHPQSRPKNAAGAPAARPEVVPANAAYFATLDPTDVDLPSQHPSRVLRRPLEFTQYAAAAYIDQLAAIGAVGSMSRTACCYDNAPMESFFHTLKVELVRQRRWTTHDEARRDLFAYLEGYYNRQRSHSAIGYLTPEQAERPAA